MTKVVSIFGLILVTASMSHAFVNDRCLNTIELAQIRNSSLVQQLQAVQQDLVDYDAASLALDKAKTRDDKDLYQQAQHDGAQSIEFDLKTLKGSGISELEYNAIIQKCGLTP